MKITSLFLTLSFYAFSAIGSTSQASDKIEFLPGFGVVKNTQFAGYLPIGKSNQSGKLFYWYVENRDHHPNAPTVLWLNGGPGAASLYGFFMENGPYSVNKSGELSERRHAWSNDANYLVIDQPAGVGFSYGNKNTFANESQAMNQLYYALQTFFQQHPELASNPFYIAGESYAGKYIPELAVRIISGRQKIPLKGILLGDAWVNPRLQQSANADFAYSHGLINRKGYLTVKKLYAECAREIAKKTPTTHLANQTCEKMQEFIQKQDGALDTANIAKGAQPDDSDMVNYLNNPSVRNALHIDSRIEKFSNSSDSVAYALEIGEQDSVANLYPILLAAGIRIWIYNGLEDGKDSNFLGTDLWLSQLNWSGKKEFSNAESCIWKVDNSVAGYAKTAAGLTQIKVRNAGHLAPIDQPARLQDLFNHFIKNQTLC